MIEKVLIQRDRVGYAALNGFVARLGFEERGEPIESFDWADLDQGRLDLKPSHLVVGSVGTVRRAVEILGRPVPAPLDYPPRLSSLLGRQVTTSTWGEIRRRYNDQGPPIFVKPRVDPKAFRGYVVQRFRDLIPTARFPDAMELVVSDVVEFVSEWRYFILRAEVIGVGHYHGNPLHGADARIVCDGVELFGGDAPAAYALDFGVTDDGRTLLVEANDGYALGAYGLGPLKYSKLLEARWAEMAGL